jgi:hypothetical protein
VADQQQANTVATPAPSAPVPNLPTTPEAAQVKLDELNADKAWRDARENNGPASAQANQEDALLRIIAGAPLNPVTAPGTATLTPEAARVRLAELKADPAWVKARLDGGNKSAQAHEEDALLQIVASAGRLPAVTPGEARAAALEQVPEKPEGYGQLPFKPGDLPPAEGITQIQGWMHTAGLTRSEAQTVVSLAHADIAKWQGLNEEQRGQHKTDTVARFNRMHGAEAPAMLEGARRLARELCAKDSMLESFLQESGAGSSLAVINALAAAAKRRYGK